VGLVSILIMPYLLIWFFLIKNRSFALTVGREEKHLVEITRRFRRWGKTSYSVVIDSQKKIEINDRQIEEWNLNDFSVLDYEL
jgi:hypothetical protein